MKLTYWMSRCTNDSEVYNIRAKTKKEVITQLLGRKGYEPPIKVTVEYKDAFDLMEQCSNEDHHHWEVHY
jgi:hypothetical protein